MSQNNTSPFPYDASIIEEADEDITPIILPKKEERDKPKRTRAPKKKPEDLRKHQCIMTKFGAKDQKPVYLRYAGLPLILEIKGELTDVKVFEKAKRLTLNHVNITKMNSNPINNDNIGVADTISTTLTSYFKDTYCFEVPIKKVEAESQAFCPRFIDNEKILKINMWNNAANKVMKKGEKINIEDAINKAVSFKVQITQCAAGINGFDESKVSIFPIFKLISNIEVSE